MLPKQWEQCCPPVEGKGMEMRADRSRAFSDTGDADLSADFIDIYFILIFDYTWCFMYLWICKKILECKSK